MKKVISMTALAFLLLGDGECARRGVKLQVVPGSEKRVKVAEQPAAVKYVAYIRKCTPIDGPVAGSLRVWGRAEDSCEIEETSARGLVKSLKEGTIMNAEYEGKVYGGKVGVLGSFMGIGGDGAVARPFDATKHQLRVNIYGLDQLLDNLKPEFCVAVELSKEEGSDRVGKPLKLKITTWESAMTDLAGERAIKDRSNEGDDCVVLELAD